MLFGHDAGHLLVCAGAGHGFAGRQWYPVAIGEFDKSADDAAATFNDVFRALRQTLWQAGRNAHSETPLHMAALASMRQSLFGF